MNGNRLSETVIEGGYCIGCGACAAVDASPFVMQYDRHGRLQAHLTGSDRTGTVFEALCPFASQARDEDGLAEEFLPAARQHHPATGRFISCRIGHVDDPEIRACASSGGIGRWLPAELLRRNLVDAVVHVAPNTVSSSSADLFSYVITRDPEEMLRTARSAYYPVSLDQVVARMRREPGRYAVTGVPCFIKALRLLSLQDRTLRERVVFTIGIICGHLKSTAFAEALAWQLGVAPADLRGIDFRGKLAGRPANHKGVRAKSATGTWSATRSSKELLGGNWGLGFFKYEACDYCDDVTAETADVAVGDAWLPQYVRDSRGTSVIVCRHPVIDALLEEAQQAGRLRLVPSSAEEVARSQAGGLRHRREGLAHRLARADREGRWRPPKRTRPDSARPSSRRKRLYDLRVVLTETSHEAFRIAREAGSFDGFRNAMRPWVRKYEEAQTPWHKNAFSRIKRLATSPLDRLKGLMGLARTRTR